MELKQKFGVILHHIVIFIERQPIQNAGLSGYNSRSPGLLEKEAHFTNHCPATLVAEANKFPFGNFETRCQFPRINKVHGVRRVAFIDHDVMLLHFLFFKIHHKFLHMVACREHSLKLCTQCSGPNDRGASLLQQQFRFAPFHAVIHVW